MQAQNQTIQNGLKRLGKELTEQTKKEELTRLIEASTVFETYGIQNRKFSANFRKWIAITKTSREQLEEIVKKAYTSSLQLFRDKSDAALITYDQEHLELQLGSVIIYFESLYFEDYVGAQKINLGTWDFPIPTMITAQEYLRDNWEYRAKDYILNNLIRAEIEDSEIEELLNG